MTHQSNDLSKYHSHFNARATRIQGIVSGYNAPHNRPVMKQTLTKTHSCTITGAEKVSTVCTEWYAEATNPVYPPIVVINGSKVV
jgi:hypothetical protein